MWKFHNNEVPTLLAFLHEKIYFLRMGSNFTWRFQMLILKNSASLMKFGEFWEDVTNLQYFREPALSAFFASKILTSLNKLKFHKQVSDGDSNKFFKFDEIRWNLRRCENFIINRRAGRCNSLSCPTGQLAPRGKLSREILPPPWLSSPPGGKLSRPFFLAPPPSPPAQHK